MLDGEETFCKIDTKSEANDGDHPDLDFKITKLFFFVTDIAAKMLECLSLTSISIFFLCLRIHLKYFFHILYHDVQAAVLLENIQSI